MKNIFLYPGQLATSEEPALITTMLGSCVGIAVYDVRRKVGGLNHYLLPQVIGEEQPSPRYGVFALPKLIEDLVQSGSMRGDLVARVFGGAAVLGAVSIGQKIGVKNVELAISYLEKENIRILDRNVGGEKGRKIVFNTSTGEVAHSFAGDTDGGKVDVSGFGHFNEAKDVRVLIVDDSATVRSLFEKIFTRAGLTVVGAASNAFEAREMIAKQKPDVITLDIEMPQMNGVKFLEKIMTHLPIPVVMVSSLGNQGEAALESMRLGAIEFVQKPSQHDPELLRQLAQSLVTKVRAAATASLLKTRPAPAAVATESAARPRTQTRGQVAGIFVSGNTGAPASVGKMLAHFTGDTPPVVIAVSTLSSFLESYVQDLKKKTRADCRVAQDGMLLVRGCVYFVPEGVQPKVVASGSTLTLKLEKGPHVNGQLPSGDRLLTSAAEALGAQAVGILLSGFGSDGIQGLGAVQAKGGFTLAENPSEAGFPFVPQGAIAQGFASEVISAAKIFDILMEHRDRRSA